MVLTLVKELQQNQTSPDHLPFNDDALRMAIEELRTMFDNYKLMRASTDLNEDISAKAKLYLISLQLKRHKRILLGYQVDRLLKLSRRMLNSTDFYQSSLCKLSKAETKFYHLQTDNIVQYKAKIGDQINLFGPILPPKDFFIQVMVEEDCGVIQTEYGQLALDRGTIHYLKRSDVEHLIIKGYLTHIL